MRSGQSKKAALHRNLNCMRPVACAQLADHVLHVALYCFFGDREAVPDSFVRVAPGYKVQNLDLPFGQIVDFKTLSQTFGDRRGNAPESLMDFSYRSNKFRTKRTLEEVSDSACRHSSRRSDITRIGRQDHDACPWEFTPNSFYCFDSPHPGHLQIHQGYIGAEFSKLLDSLLTA